jgi:integrase
MSRADPSPTCPPGKVVSAKAGCGRSGNKTGSQPRVSPSRHRTALETNHIRKLLSEYRPNVARGFLKAFRPVCTLAVEHGTIPSDPTSGIKIAPPQSDGHKTWSEDEIAIFEGRWPIGTRERLAFGLLLFTGQRRGDTIRMSMEQFKNGLLTVRQSKTGTGVGEHP